ncbi:hypothetical protein D3C74_322640 [compost metagenome]
MDHDQVEMRHRTADERIEVRMVGGPSHELVDEFCNEVGVRPGVEVTAGRLVRDEDLPAAVLTGALVESVGQEHVVHGTEDRCVEREVLVAGGRQDEPERLAIARDLAERLDVSADRFVALDRGVGVVEGDVVPLDAVRPLDCPRDGRLTKPPYPPSGRADLIGECTTHRRELAEDALVVGSQHGEGVEHDPMSLI